MPIMYGMRSAMVASALRLALLANNVALALIMVGLLLLTGSPVPLNAGAQPDRHVGQYTDQQGGSKIFLPFTGHTLAMVGPLAAVSSSPSRYDVFGVDSSDHIIQFWFDNGWNTADLGLIDQNKSGGGLAGPITAASWGPDRYDIFAVGRNGHIVQLWYANGWRWDDLGPLPAGVNANSFAETITAASWKPGQYDIYGIDEQSDHHRIFRLSYDGGWKWADGNWANGLTIPTKLDGGSIAVRITATAWTPGRSDVFGIAADSNLVDHIFQFWYDGADHWTDLGSLPQGIGGGHFGGRIAAASWRPGRYDIFGLGWNTHVVQIWHDGGSQRTDPGTASSSTAGALATCQTVAVVFCDLGAVPSDIGGGGFAYPSPITAASLGLGRYDIFGVGRNGHIIQFWYDGAWQWADLGLTS